MKITIETQWTTSTTEFNNSDVTMAQIAEALRGMLLSNGWHIDIIDEYIKTE
jgi:hypothetical protein